jgi:hypothetical protein
MPETSAAGRQLAPAQLTERLAGLVHGPYDDLDTTGAAGPGRRGGPVHAGRPGERHPMISAAQAAVRARQILGYPAGDPGNGWELEEFAQGWLVHWRGWKGQPGQFSIVIEREAGVVRYFTTFILPQAITAGYEAVRELGRCEEWTSERQAPVRPPRSGGRATAGQPPPARSARRPGAVPPRTGQPARRPPSPGSGFKALPA